MKLLLLFFLICSFISLNGQVINFDNFKSIHRPYSQHNIQGKVKSITSNYFVIRKDSIGKPFKKEINPSVSTGNIEFLEFDKKGRVTMEATIFRNRIDGHRVYTYFTTGDTVRMQEKYGSGKVVHDQILFYERENSLLKLHELFPIYRLPEKQFLIYYNKAGFIDSVFARTQTRDLGSYKFSYPNDSTVIRNETRDSGRKGETRKSTVNKNGQVILEVFSDSGEENYRIQYRYDQYGNCVEKKCSGGVSFGTQQPDENGNLNYVFKMTYDEKRNWILRKTYANGIQISECKRNIVYYN